MPLMFASNSANPPSLVFSACRSSSKLGLGRSAVSIEISTQGHLRDGALHRSLQHAVLKVYTELRVVQIARKAQPSADAQSEIDIHRVQLAEADGLTLQFAIGVEQAGWRRIAGSRRSPEKGTQVQRR